jgi:hypothetical protein
MIYDPALIGTERFCSNNNIREIATSAMGFSVLK